MQNFFLISLGAILGANARYWLTSWVSRRWGDGFPLGTLLINLSGSLILGLLIALTLDRVSVNPRLRTLLVVGFLGSYTTFSSYTNDSIGMLLNGQWGQGLFNLIGSALLGGLAAAIGILIGRSL